MLRGIFAGLEAIDHFWDRILTPVTKAWCWLTGKSNFTLARAAYAMALILIVYAHVAAYLDDRNTFLLLFGVPLWCWIIRKRWRDVQHIEDTSESATDVLKFDLHVMTGIVIERLLFSLWMFFLVPGLFVGEPSSYGFGLFVAGNYFLFHFHGGGKSVLRRTADLGKKLIEKAKDLVPEPTPVPVPVGR